MFQGLCEVGTQLRPVQVALVDAYETQVALGPRHRQLVGPTGVAPAWGTCDRVGRRALFVGPLTMRVRTADGPCLRGSQFGLHLVPELLIEISVVALESALTHLDPR